MAKGNKNTGGYQKKHAVPAEEKTQQTESAAADATQEQATNEAEKQDLPPIPDDKPPAPALKQEPVKSVSVQSVTNECISLIQQLSRREQTEVFKNIRRAI